MVSSRVHSNDVQRLFLQAIMSRRIMSDKIVKLLWQKSTEAVNDAAPELDITFNNNEADWNAFLNKVNNSLNPFDLEFRFIVDEVSSVKTWALINTKGDEVAHLASDYSPTEIAYFKALVEQIVLASNCAYSISSIAALREVSHLKQANFTKAQAEIVLASFVARGWLLRSKRGRYSLASRTILELGNYLAQTYGDDVIIDCVICQEIVTKGVCCATQNCRTFMHKHCHKRVLKTRKNCPSCQTIWDDDSSVKPVGEDAARDGQTERRKTRRSSTDNADEEEEEEEEEQSQYLDDSQPPTQSQSQSQAKSQSQSQGEDGKGKNSKKSLNGRSKRREETPPDSDEGEGQVGVMDIDDLPSIRERPSRLHKRG